MTPFENIVTTYSSQPKDKNGNGILYNNYRDCIIKMLRKQGITSFVKGFDSVLLKTGPHTLLCLVFWDGFKHVNEHYISSAGQNLENSD